MRTRLLRVGFLGLAFAAAAAPARADATLLVGLNTPSAPSPSIGVAWGFAPGTVGFELEYAATPGQPSATRTAVRTISGNLVVDTPVRVHGGRVYVIGGLGLYGETGRGRGSGEVAATDFGVGMKIPVAGAIKFRLDYRVFLGHTPDASGGFPKSVHSQRFSAGLTLAF